MGKPILPSEVIEAHQRALPEEVFDAFNELIAKKWDGSSATVYQRDVVSLILEKMHLDADDRGARQSIFDKGWMDVEACYRAAGWEVHYDKPGYCETYEPTFSFRKAKATR